MYISVVGLVNYHWSRPASGKARPFSGGGGADCPPCTPAANVYMYIESIILLHCVLYTHLHCNLIQIVIQCTLFLSLSPDEGSSRYYVGLAFSLALQLNTTLLDACTQITELVPTPTTQPQDKDINHKENSSNGCLNTGTPGEPSPPGLIRPMTELSLEETAASHDDGIQQQQDDPRNEESELELYQFPQGQSSPVDIGGEGAGSLHGGSLLADASVELLCALDLLSIILPGVRVWLDWMRTHKDLWMSFALKNIETSLMWVYIYC